MKMFHQKILVTLIPSFEHRRIPVLLRLKCILYRKVDEKGVGFTRVLSLIVEFAEQPTDLSATFNLTFIVDFDGEFTKVDRGSEVEQFNVFKSHVGFEACGKLWSISGNPQSMISLMRLATRLSLSTGSSVSALRVFPAIKEMDFVRDWWASVSLPWYRVPKFYTFYLVPSG